MITQRQPLYYYKPDGIQVYFKLIKNNYWVNVKVKNTLAQMDFYRDGATLCDGAEMEIVWWTCYQLKRFGSTETGDSCWETSETHWETKLLICWALALMQWSQFQRQASYLVFRLTKTLLHSGTMEMSPKLYSNDSTTKPILYKPLCHQPL